MNGGRVLGGRYELLDRVGRGGMAEVFRAFDRVLERRVAVKVLAVDGAEDESLFERFRREARTSASLTHPNVVSVYDTGVDDDVHYIVMELVEGPSLVDLLRREGPLEAL
ncbi:MAG: protein kinase, partial [Actinomycetota bacterium]|nr:protein kinase [Actinomycetota bacterium]